jgi:hypothetical protein
VITLSSGPADDGEEFPRLTDAEFDAIMNAPLPAEYAHLRPFGADDPDVFVTMAAEAGPGGQTLSLLAATPLTALTETGRSTALQELEKLTSHLEARKADLIAAIAGPEPITRAAKLDDFSAEEIAMATRCSVYAADAKIALARKLAARWRATLAVMTAGGVSLLQARLMIESVDHLDEDLRAELEVNLLKYAHRQSPANFRRSVSRWLAKKDPGWGRRAEMARRDVVVEHHANDDGTGELFVRGPLEHTHLINLALTAAAGQLKPDLGGTVAQRKLAVLRDWADATLTRDGAPTHHGMAVRVQLVTTASTALGRDERPVEIPGIGFVPASAARWAIADGADVQAMLVDKRSGYLVAVDPTVYQVPARLADLLISRYVTAAAPHSGVPAAGCDMEHNLPHPSGPTDEQNVTPIDRRWHRAKTHGRWTYLKNPDSGVVTWRSPTGMTLDIDPYGYFHDP